MANDTNRFSFTYDSNLLFKDAGLVAASAAATVGGVAKIIDVGDSEFRGWMIIDWTACEVDSSNEKYVVTVQGGARAAGSTRDSPLLDATKVDNLSSYDFGHTSVRNGNAITSPATGRLILPFRNVVNDIQYPILRVFTTVSGTVATGINYSAWAGKGLY